ncbi:MAG: CoA ester lyase [Dehalococcoidia bacterium]|nr:CoA ester lyase [Dehalococcoidia bacterium]
MTHDDLLLRTLLFVPAHREPMLPKALAAGADAVVFDLEDAVPPAGKAHARAAAARALAASSPATTLLVRVNPVRSGFARDDLLTVVRPGLAGVVLPKAESPQDVRDLDVLLREAEMANGVRPGDVATIPLIESPRGLLRAEDIARASDRIIALSIGGEDYCAELGVERTVEGTALASLRYRIVELAAAHALAAIDTPYADVRDAAGLVAETRFARAVGFRGKYVLHPDQVRPVNDVFTPSDREVAAARALVAAYDDGVAAGAGAVSVDGRMVDAPAAARARRLIARAERIAARVTAT